VTATLLVERAETYLRKLCEEIPSRRVGSKGNRAATDFYSTKRRKSAILIAAKKLSLTDTYSG